MSVLDEEVDLAALAVAMIPIVGELINRFPGVSAGYSEILESTELDEMLRDNGLAEKVVHVPEVHGEIDGVEPGDEVTIFTKPALQIREIYNAYRNSNCSS